METFSGELKHLRRAAGLKQQDVVQALGGAVARSTLASVESGREKPSRALMAAIEATWPEWAEKLQPHFARTQAEPAHLPSLPEQTWPMDGPYLVDRIHYVFNFDKVRTPTEIISVRKVRTVEDAAQEFGLSRNLQGPKDGFEMESLWGGDLVTNAEGKTRFRFPEPLGRGERHEFAVRTWIRQPRPETEAVFLFSLPTQWAEVTLNFRRGLPSAVWSFDEVSSRADIPTSPSTENRVELINGRANVGLDKPTTRKFFGVMWRW